MPKATKYSLLAEEINQLKQELAAQKEFFTKELESVKSKILHERQQNEFHFRQLRYKPK